VRIDTLGAGAASSDGGVILRVVDTGTGTPPPNNAGDMYYVGLLEGAVKFGFMQGGTWTQWSQVSAPVSVTCM
jgi:hypothetical protein